MKKLLLSCCLALGIGANAQISYTADFEDAGSPGYNTTLYGQFGGGSRTAAAACAGAYGGQLAIGSTVNNAPLAQSGWMLNLDELGQATNGQQATLTVSYKKSSGVAGTFRLAYFVKNDAGLWEINYVGSPITVTKDALTSCATATATIPAGVLSENTINAVGMWFTRATSTDVGNIYVDNITIKQDVVTAVPGCAAFTYPTTGSTISGGTNALTWNTVPTASSYKITIGSTPGGSDVLNKVVDGSVKTINASLGLDKTYYAKIVASNIIGDAVGCEEITFKTSSNLKYCGPLGTTQTGVVAPIKSVNFAGVTKTSDANATTLGNFSSHEDFTSTIFPVSKAMTSIPITVGGITNGNPQNGWAMSVFIDWNNDGDFDDAGEQYFNKTSTMIRKAGVSDNPIMLTGNITVPAGTSYGKKVMRVKYNFSGTTIHTALESGCSELGNGQAEDYTIDYKESLAVSDVNTVKTSLFPNPFKDVLKISDIKGATSITVSDISGRTVKTLAPATELQLGDLKRGMYIVTIKFENGTVSTAKVIKE